MNSLSLNSILSKIFWPLSLMIFIIVAIRSYVIPIHHDEAATFFFFIQSGKYLPEISNADANNHILNSISSFICFKLFGDSLFSIRLPNTISFLVLAFGVWRLLKTVRTSFSKVILICGFFLSFHFLSFFSTSRGYGISMAFLVLSLSYFTNYLKSQSRLELTLTFVFFQLAIAANLTLLMVILPLIGILIISQILHRSLKIGEIIIHLINFILLWCWIQYAFFLQNNGALYYGGGTEGYYTTTYLSLFYLLVGFKNEFPAFFISFLMLSITLKILLNIYRQRPPIIALSESKSFIYILLMGDLIIEFYLLKKIMGVNYPEDRTGLFFYVFFILFLAYTLDNFKIKNEVIASSFIMIIAMTHFILFLNFRKHSLINYESIPQRFYDRLVEEQKNHLEKITISGHRMRELFFAYDNYRNDGALNLADGADYLYLNGDYAIALKNEEKDYAPYYREIDFDPDWNYVLLKRKHPLKRELMLNINPNLHFEGNDEFYNIFIQSHDTILPGSDPILAEFDFQIKNWDVPNRAWLVMQIDTAQDAHYYYKRIPLSWLHYKWDENKTYTYALVSGPIQKKLTTLGFYIYNTGKQHVSIDIKSLKLYRLKGEGSDRISDVLN